MSLRKVLVVDDDRDILEIVGIILEDAGYSVDLLPDGNKIFEHIDVFSPDVIILDVMLGTADGRVLCNQIKNDDHLAHIPVIMISASHNLKQILNEQCSPDDFLEKPFETDILLDKIQNVIHQ